MWSRTSAYGIISRPAKKNIALRYWPSPTIPSASIGFSTARISAPSFRRPTRSNLKSMSKDSAGKWELRCKPGSLADVTQRLRHMDALGIDVQVLYNSLWLRPLTRRPEVEIALCWSWNRWLADVWRLGENRLRWTCVVPALTPTEAAPQIRFAQEHGAVGVCVRHFERGKLMTDPFYYPIYDEAQRLDIPLTVHIANGNPDLFDLLNNEAGGGFSTFRVPTVTACYALIMSEIPRVFAKLRWGFIETSSQWVPWVVHEAVRRSSGGEHPVSMNCFRDCRIYVSTQTDDDFSYVISYAGEENLVIGTDYGHGDTSSELNAISRFKAMEGLNPQVKRKILSDNPRRFYGI